ncbi:MAG: tetratricopeptide repeat protein [Cyclonatronaceae bacterium]
MKSYTKMAVLALLLAGFIAGCGGDPNIESAKLNIRNKDFNKAIESAQTALVANPQNAEAYYYIGLAYSEKALLENVYDREEFIASSRENLLKAQELFQEQELSTSESRNVPVLIDFMWRVEYNDAIELVDFERESHPDTLGMAIQHLKNAATANPDSAMTYDVLAELYYRNDDLPNAISSVQKSIEVAGDNDLSRYYRLAYFYQQANEPDNIIDIMTRAYDIWPDDIEVVQELAYAYMRVGRTEEATDVVNDLINRQPDNAEYRVVYGTQLYQNVLTINDELSNNLDKLYDLNRELNQAKSQRSPDQSVINRLQTEIDSLEAEIETQRTAVDETTAIAEEQLSKAIEIEPRNVTANYFMGVIHQNRAATLFDLRNITEDNEQAMKYNDQAMAELNMALPYYEMAAEVEPDNTDFWVSLFRVYTTLGMMDKAEEAQRKAGL